MFNFKTLKSPHVTSLTLAHNYFLIICLCIYIYIFKIFVICFLSSLSSFLLFICLLLFVLGLHYCERVFSSCSKQGLLFAVVHGLLIVVVSFVVEHRL